MFSLSTLAYRVYSCNDRLTVGTPDSLIESSQLSVDIINVLLSTDILSLNKDNLLILLCHELHTSVRLVYIIYIVFTANHCFTQG